MTFTLLSVLSLIMTILRFIHVFVCIDNLFLVLLNIPWFHSVFSHLLVDGHLYCFQHWTVTCKDVMNTSVQAFF